MVVARYDGFAEWYDQTFAEYADLDTGSSSAAALVRLLGPGEGWCLDLACGTGLHLAAVEHTGRRAVGVDISGDQLRVARRRTRRRSAVDPSPAPWLARADATRLPFADRSFPAVVCTFVHTDTDAIAAVFAEVERVLIPGGRLVYLGVHPCFRGHFVEQHADRRVIHPGYWETGWHHESPHRTYRGVRERVGEHHMTFAELVTALLDSGLRLIGIEESDRGEPIADRMALVAVKEAPNG